MERINDWLEEITYAWRVYNAYDFVDNPVEEIQKQALVLQEKYNIKDWRIELDMSLRTTDLGSGNMVIYVREKLLHTDDAGKSRRRGS